jgi:hypothetical protein
VFIKEKTDCWRYVGKWYAVHRSENPGALAEANRRASRDDVGMVLKLAEAEN